MYKEAFATRIKYAREKTGLSQRDVAKELRISQSAIANYETGKREPDIETMGTLADFYQVSIDWLLGFVLQQNNRANYEITIPSEVKKIVNQN